MVETHPLTCTFLDTIQYHNAEIRILSRIEIVVIEERQSRCGDPSTLSQTMIETACDFVELGFQATTLDKVSNERSF
jgi:hypothetical protein